MRDFPKRLATAEDIRNCKSLVDDGAFAAKDLLDAIEDLESMNYLHCPVLAVGEDKKTVTTGSWDDPYIVFLCSLMDRHGPGGGCIKHNRQRNRSSIGGLPWNKYDYEHL